MSGFIISAMLPILATLAGAGDERKDAPKVHDAAKSPQATGGGELERLKKLAGEWVLAKADKDEADEVIAIFKVTAGGTAVIETRFPGSDQEVITVFYQHKDDLLLTHFSSLGNQPRMKAERASKRDILTFRFMDGTNLRTDKDAHLRILTLTFIDDDHLKEEWTLVDNGNEQPVKSFELKRKPAQ